MTKTREYSTLEGGTVFTMANLLLTDISKIAMFLLFFALVALLFEIFYFRRKRVHQEAPLTASPLPNLAAESPPKAKARITRKNLVIIGVVLMLLVLPASLYVASQRVSFEQQAQVQQTGQQIQYGCDRIDVQKGGAVVDPSSLAANDTVTFIGYCYGSSSLATINRLRFTLRTPGGIESSAVYLAFPDATQSTTGKQYFKASYPNIKLPEAGSYAVSVAAYNLDTALTQQPFAKNFVIGQATQALTQPSPTPTRIVTAATQAVGLPTCSGLSAIPLTGPAPLTVSLTGSGTNSGGQITAFEFTFGDLAKQTVSKNVGSSGSSSISHVYQAAGTYNASLRVQDSAGNFSSPSALCSVQIKVTSTSTATTSAQLQAQPTTIITATPTPVVLPKAGIDLPIVGVVGTGLLLLTFGLLLAF